MTKENQFDIQNYQKIINDKNIDLFIKEYENLLEQDKKIFFSKNEIIGFIKKFKICNNTNAQETFFHSLLTSGLISYFQNPRFDNSIKFTPLYYCGLKLKIELLHDNYDTEMKKFYKDMGITTYKNAPYYFFYTPRQKILLRNFINVYYNVIHDNIENKIKWNKEIEKLGLNDSYINRFIKNRFFSVFYNLEHIRLIEAVNKYEYVTEYYSIPSEYNLTLSFKENVEKYYLEAFMKEGLNHDNINEMLGDIINLVQNMEKISKL